jgi:hypothetical protein
MIFAFLEDGTLEVHEDLIAVQRAYEGVDVENEVVRFYDESGTYLEPQFIVPNRRGKTLGIFGWVSSGIFKLVANPQAPQDSFALALYETATLTPNRWFATLEHLKSELAKKGVAVELLPTERGEA